MLSVKQMCGIQRVTPESRQQVFVLSKKLQASGSVLSSGGSRAGSTVTASFARLLSLCKRAVMSLLLLLDASHESGSKKHSSFGSDARRNQSLNEHHESSPLAATQ
jgi:hypothetical protein